MVFFIVIQFNSQIKIYTIFIKMIKLNKYITNLLFIFYYKLFINNLNEPKCIHFLNYKLFTR